MASPEEAPAATDLFLALTPERVLAAVECAGVRTRPLCYPLNSFENRVYEVELEDRTRVIAKFYRPGRWTREQILEEHRFLDDLAEQEIPVGEPLKFADGSSLHQIEGISYALFERRGGRAPDELDDALAERLGMLVGRLHTVAVERPAPHRLPLDADTFLRRNLAWLRDHGSLPPHLQARYLDTGFRLADQLEELAEGTPTHRLHGDLHLGNLLLRDGVLTLVDFDDMVDGPPVQDLWLAVPGRDDWSARLRERFLTGYERFRLFDRSTLRLIEPLRALRLVHYATWLARRWHDPIFPATWPHFGSDEYWRTETEALEDQLARILRERGTGVRPGAPPAGGAALPAEEALTNKDYFWDWEGD
jgi:Ser/Thr protein kinase RdoA (MazF antagonist)